MKKLLIILTVLFIAPLTVNAYEINTDFDADKCELIVTGSLSGHDADVKIFLSSTKELKGMQTGLIENGNYTVTFVQKYDVDTLVDIVVVNEEAQNRTEKLSELVPACEIEHSSNPDPSGPEDPPAPVNHLVHFNTNGGSNISDIEIPHEGKVERPQLNPEKDGFVFGGWYEDQGLTSPFDFNRGILEETTIYARWIEDDNTKEYTLTDPVGNTISFIEEKGLNFSLDMVDILLLTPEQFEQMTGLPKEAFEVAKEQLKELLKSNGTMLAIYGIEVTRLAADPADNRAEHDGPFQIKIKLTDELKKYDTFKLIYIDSDNNGDLITGEVIELSVDGDYLVGTLNHLSTYALVGSNTPESPKTNDNIMKFVNILTISLIGLTISGLSAYKLKTNKVKIK